MEGDVTANNLLSFTHGEVKHATKMNIRLHSGNIRSQFKDKTYVPKMLTLIGEDPSLEKDLIQDFDGNLNIHSVEYNPTIFEKQKEIIAAQDLPINLHQGDVQEHIIETQNKYAIIYLDLCCTRTDKIHQLIDSIFEKGFDKQVENCLFAVTLSIRNEKDFLANAARFYSAKVCKGDKDKYEKKLKRELNYIREVSAPEHWGRLANQHNATIKPLRYWRYLDLTDKAGATTMYTYLFNVSKDVEDVDFHRYNLCEIKGNNMVERPHILLRRTIEEGNNDETQRAA